jgi:NADH dehydrogenase
VPYSDLGGGEKAGDLIKHLSVPTERKQRVPVKLTLQLSNHLEIFVIGDAAFLKENDRPLPMMAPVAIQHGRLAARNILNLINGMPLESFQYKDPGALATIGRNRVVARIGKVRFTGLPAWIVWVIVHIYGLIGFRNRLLVLVNWIWDYIFLSGQCA